MTHKEMTKHIRTRIHKSGIQAKCSMTISCGQPIIRVNVTGPDVEWTDVEQKEIRIIAKANHLSMARGGEIDIERMTNPQEFWFEFHG